MSYVTSSKQTALSLWGPPSVQDLQGPMVLGLVVHIAGGGGWGFLCSYAFKALENLWSASSCTEMMVLALSVWAASCSALWQGVSLIHGEAMERPNHSSNHRWTLMTNVT
jgi:hypothetical protein